MRQLTVQVPAGGGERVVDAARRCSGANITLSGARDATGDPVDVVQLHLPNDQVGPFVEAVNGLDGLHIALQPQPTIALRPPADEVAQQVHEVHARSPFEIVLAGLQSVGSRGGFSAYAAIAGVVVWLGLFTDTIYLLVGAMMLAPFAGPAMNTAVATARGDWPLLWRSLARYSAALAITAAVSATLSLVFRQTEPTALMAAIANLSAPAFLLPLAAGAGGALHLAQSERSSLVSGAAVGILVAASLAPPAGLIGMATVTGDGAMVVSGVFLLILQLVGINLAGALVFRVFGLTPTGVRYPRGHGAVRSAALAGSALGLAAVLVWQFGTDRPELQRSSAAARARTVLLQAIREEPKVEPVRVTAEFTRPDVPGQHTLFAEVVVQRSGAATGPDGELAERLARVLRARIPADEFGAVPLVHVTVLRPPPSGE